MPSSATRSVSGTAPLLAVLLLAGAARAQTTTPPGAPADTSQAASQRRAAQVLAASVDALGGREAVLGARGYDVRLGGTTAGSWRQARRMADSTSTLPLEVRYALDGRERRGFYESSSVSPGRIRFYNRTVVDTAGTATFDLLRWRTGTDLQRGPAAQARAALGEMERFLPHAMLQQALGRDSTLRYAGEAEQDGARHHLVTYTTAEGRRLTLRIDARSGLPASLSPRENLATEYSDYRPVGGVRVPHRMVTRFDGQVVNDLRVTRVELRPALADSLLAVPAGYAPAPAPGTPRATRIGEGVYRLDDMPGGYHAAFVVQDGHVAVLEAPQDPRWTEAALRLIEEAAPGKPVRYVFVTHHHSDHVGGLAPYVARGATLVTGPGVDEAVRRQLPDSLRPLARFQVVSDRAVFGSGAGRVEAFVVPNEHADGNLAFYLPAQRVLFQGDLFYIPERGAVPPAFPVTADLDRVVRRRGLAVDQVVGVHGRTGTWQEVGESLRRAGSAPPR